MKIIGITGPSGAGKSICADLCRKLSFPVFDADAVYHSVIVPPSPCLDELRDRFGPAVFNCDGTLCRKKLAEIVFSDKSRVLQKELNAITHRYVLDAIRHGIESQRKKGAPAVFVDAPLLIESGFHSECDAVITILSDRKIRLQRIMSRDGISQEDAQRRIDAQPDDAFYQKSSDYVIYNDESIDKAIDALQRVFAELGLMP